MASKLIGASIAGSFPIASRCSPSLIAGSEQSLCFGQRRTYRNWVSKFRRQMYYIKKDMKPAAPSPRSSFLEWNYDAELFSFGKRLGEDFSPATLRRALTHKSFVEVESTRREQFGLTGSDSAGNEDNRDLVGTGRSFVSDYLFFYLRKVYQDFPAEGIRCLVAYLTSDEVLSNVGLHIGLKDILLSAEYPPNPTTLADTFLAIVACVEGEENRQKFVRDFVATQLINKNVLELWNPVDPKRIVTEILKIQGKPSPEPRLLRQFGPGTIEANYVVGVYCEKSLLGHSSGETVTIAEKAAFTDVLRRMFRVEENRTPLSSVPADVGDVMRVKELNR